MRSSVAGAMVMCGAIALAAVAQQTLVCPPPTTASARACELFHYHVQAYRPDTRQFAELIAVNQFASQSACERARDAQIKRNLAVVDFFKRVRDQQQYEPDRFGPCHCDMTTDKSSVVFTTDAQRTLQLRTAEEVRLRVRERLLNEDLTSDNELVRGLIAPPASLPLLSGPKFVPLPAAAATPTVTNSPDDLQATKAIDTSRPTVATLDLPLVDPVGGEGPAQLIPSPSAPAVAANGSGSTAPQVPPTAAPAQPSPAVAIQPSSAQTTDAPSSDAASAADAADSFIEYETQRIQNVLKASSAISDETVKSKIFESCMQRIQLLSNLRSLIEGSGSRSRLAAAAHAARSESERLEFVSHLFGDSIAALWAPKDATDVVLPPNPDVDNEPERVLRDGSGRFGTAQKKRALYLLLARSQPTDDQQLWLVTIIDGFLR